MTTDGVNSPMPSSTRACWMPRSTTLAQHQAAVASWQWFGNVARGVVGGDPAAYRAVLDHLSPFSDLEELGTVVTVDEAASDVLVMLCFVGDSEIVPREEVKLGAGGKLLRKDLPKGRYWELYQDYVCACALRVARDVASLLPVPRVVVNIANSELDTSTGHRRTTTILAVSFLRTALSSLNFDACDPSNAMVNFDHRMKFKKTTGFEPVEALAATDQFLTVELASKSKRTK